MMEIHDCISKNCSNMVAVLVLLLLVFIRNEYNALIGHCVANSSSQGTLQTVPFHSLAAIIKTKPSAKLEIDCMFFGQVANNRRLQKSQVFFQISPM